MRCSSCSPLLDRYLEGTLSTQQFFRVSGHLAECNECTAILEELKVVDGLLHTIRTPQPLPNFTYAVMAEVRSMPLPHTPRLNVAALLGGYIVIAWALIAIWMRLAGITTQSAWAQTASAGAHFFENLGGVGSAAMHSFGHGSPNVTIFVTSVLALDVAVLLGVILIYGVVRPRLAAQLASIPEGS